MLPVQLKDFGCPQVSRSWVMSWLARHAPWQNLYQKYHHTLSSDWIHRLSINWPLFFIMFTSNASGYKTKPQLDVMAQHHALLKLKLIMQPLTNHATSSLLQMRCGIAAHFLCTFITWNFQVPSSGRGFFARPQPVEWRTSVKWLRFHPFQQSIQGSDSVSLGCIFYRMNHEFRFPCKLYLITSSRDGHRRYIQ